MSTAKYLARIEETQQRFRDRQTPREEAVRSIEQGDYSAANANEALRKRLAHLGVSAAVTEQPATRGFEVPERPREAKTRAILDNVTLERILKDNDLMPITYLALGLHRARSVGRIHIILGESRQSSGFGTGFLVSPQLLLTNNHVLETADDAKYSEVEFDFEVDLAGKVRETVRFQLDPQAFFLTHEQLDFTLVAVKPTNSREPREWGWIVLSEQEGLVVKGEYVSIVQHPNGEAKQLALRENQVIDLLDNFAHYRTDTAPGSSGSPVFNDQWELVALHHSGVPERFPNGDIKSVDDKNWEPWMGDHRIKWMANEGVNGNKIVDFIKNQQDLSATQKTLRDGLFQGPSPLPTGGLSVGPDLTNSPRREGAPAPLMPGVLPPVALAALGRPAATWTVPLQLTLTLGSVTVAENPALIAPVPQNPPVADFTPPHAMDEELQQALAEARAARQRPYFSEALDRQDREQYYANININDITPVEAFHEISSLLKSTHKTAPPYKPSTHLYPWVDLHPDHKLRSIYSGKPFEPEELIREDFRIEQERRVLLRELMRRESTLTTEQLQEEVNLLEAQNPFNCEHVVPQSWFAKKEPMRGDLHHLFACESGCNSFRGNIPYFDFPDNQEVERTACGKRVGNKFEPGAGKGIVARAMLYFLLRYPGKINDPEEFPTDRIEMLLKWHSDHAVMPYERHRNQAIFAKQGNRNPLIDFPDWAVKIRFALGLG